MNATHQTSLDASRSVALRDPCPLAWHAEAWQQVTDAVAADRLGHALLLVGSAGVGKRHFAERLARSLLCQLPRPPEAELKSAASAFEACGNCPSCRQMEQGAHAGYRRLALDTTGDKQNIPVDAVRDACATLALTTAAAKAKVLLIDRADDLNASGFNALLKTLEEPAARSHLILTTEALLDLPATIRSRCQLLRFPTPSTAQGLAYLGTRIPQSSPEACIQALADTLDAPLAAAKLLTDGGRLERHLEWDTCLQTVLDGSAGPLDAAIPAQRDEAVDYSRHVAIVAWRAARHALTRNADAAPMSRVATRAIECLRHLDGNTQPRLAIESLLIACSAMYKPASRKSDRRDAQR